MSDHKDRITIVEQKDVFERIRTAVNKIVNLVKPTYGPAGNKVIISKVTHNMVVDDGVQIARDLEFEDPVENAVLKVVRETAVKTNDRVGDGTTGAMIMVQAIIEEAAALGVFDGRKIEKELKAGFEECKSQLLKSAKQIKTKEELYKVARISFDDAKIAKMVSDAWYDLGQDGVFTVDKSPTMETVVELTEGVKINRGYISPYMVSNPERMEALIEKPYILFTDYRLTETNDVIGIMNKLSGKGINSLVIVADAVEQSALATLVINKLQGKFNAVAINMPAGDGDRTLMMEDLAIMTGGKVFSEKKGDKVDKAEIADLGRASRFIAHRNDSVIVGPRGKKATVKQCIEELQKATEDPQMKQSDKEAIKRRIARFSNKIGVIKVGAATENEVNALKYKVEDAVNSTEAAYRSGVVCGAGLSLARLKSSSVLLNKALQEPFKQLKMNVGIMSNTTAGLGKEDAINVVTGEVGNWQDVGVMDPVEVIIAQLESAVSIASLLVTTSGMIVERPKHIRQEE